MQADVAKPNPKGPTRTVEVRCSKCRGHLFDYRKGGSGALVKCFRERIVGSPPDDPCHCPACGTQFARERMIRGSVAYKIIGGKVTTKR